MKGGLGLIGQSPSTACRSVWQMPVASILTKISVALGSGTGSSSIASGLPNARTTAAFIVFAFLIFLLLKRWFPGLKEAQLLRTVADQHILGLLVVIQHHFVVFTTKARLFVSAECGVSGIKVITVDPNPAGLDSASEVIATVCVAAPDSRAQSVARIVGYGESLILIPERGHRQN